MLLPLLAIAALIALNALYVAAEFAAVSVRRGRIRQRAEQGDGAARRLLPVLEDPVALDRWIAACQVGITLSSLVLGALSQATVTVALAPTLAGRAGLSAAASLSAASVVVLLLLTVLQMVVGELVPKSLALRHPTRVALATVRPMEASLRLFGPAIGVLNGSGAWVLRRLGVPATGHRHIHSPEEIDLLIAESRDGGMLEPDEHRRLRRALQLGVRPARHLMVPRPRIAGLDVDTPPDEAAARVAASPYTRLPVWRGGVDHVVGVLHTRDLLARRLDGPLPPLETLLRPIPSVPENLRADQLLARMREARSHQALVLDEYGGVAGLVTLDDVLAEVMGDIGDELKAAERAAERLADGRVRLPGFLRLDEAEPWLGVRLDGESDTLGGRVAEALGHVPAPGESVTLQGVELTVETMSRRAVATVVARPRDGDGGEAR